MSDGEETLNGRRGGGRGVIELKDDAYKEKRESG